jgi:tetratricopeptide (TPR) repeat protein
MGGQLGLSLSLHSSIEEELELQQLSLQELANRTGINRGVLSACFTRNPPKALSIKQLDMITSGLHKEEGWLYDVYAKECFSEKVHWKQLKPFLLRCVDISRYDLIENILNSLMESLVHIPDVFALAESLYSEGKWRESLPFYRCVCENEIKQHSIRMAMSQYRFFRTRLGSDLKENHEAAIQFTPYRQRLPENVQLDALLQLANVHFTLQNWEEVISYANELQNLVEVILKQKNISTRKSKNAELLITDRHLVFYYGQAYLLQGNAYEWMGQYEKSMQFIPYYEDLSWFEDLGYIGQIEVGKFRSFAEGNQLNLNILIGNFEYLTQYLLYIEQHQNEWLPSLLTIVTAANQYDKNINEVISAFNKDLENVLNYNNNLNHGYYEKTFSLQRAAKLCYQLAIYYYRRGQIELGVQWLLQAFNFSICSHDQTLTLQCVAYFEKFRKYPLSHTVIREYEQIMKGVVEDA